MNRRIILLLACGLCLGLAACNPPAEEATQTDAAQSPAQTAVQEEGTDETTSPAVSQAPAVADASPEASPSEGPLETPKASPVQPNPMIVVPGVGGDYAPEINDQIKWQYDRVMAAASDLGYEEGDVVAGHAMEDFKMVQIMARRPVDWQYAVQISVYAQEQMAEESFTLLWESAAEQVTWEDGTQVALSALTMPDAQSGEMKTEYMATAKGENAVISCMEKDRDAALSSLETLLSTEA